MKSRNKIILKRLVLWGLIFSLHQAFAQKRDLNSDESLSQGKRSAIVDKIAEIFDAYYPLPDVAVKMTNYIRQKRQNGEYDQFTDVVKFTSQLQADLRSISNDQHIRVWPYEKIPDDLLAEIKLGSPDDNYGFHKVERLPGNIGYLELTSFNNPRSAAPTAVAAMNFMARCQALIIDLRLNGGGDEAMAVFLSSYFFDKSTHLTDYHIRKDNRTEQRWSQEWVPGPKMTDVPVYILLSRFSYSSAEVFAYQLQQLGRAVIIGEKTRGGAHGVRYMSFQELSINLKVPYSRDINPYSKTNYINGVIPDVAVSADKAFAAANIEAAKNLLETETDPNKRYGLSWVQSGYAADIHPMVIDDKKMSEYVGRYGNVRVKLECGRLYLCEGDSAEHELVPMNNDLFKYKDPNEEKYRIQFVRDKTGAVIELFEHDRDGDTYPAKKRMKG